MSDCSVSHVPASRFAVGSESRCFIHAALAHRLLKISLPTCLVVGTVLTAINQGPALLRAEFPNSLVWQIPLTYSVPFLVSTWSQLRALKLADAEGEHTAFDAHPD